MQEQQDTAEVQRGETIRAFGHISSCWVELHCSNRPLHAPHLTRNVLTCHRVSGRQEIFSTQNRDLLEILDRRKLQYWAPIVAPLRGRLRCRTLTAAAVAEAAWKPVDV